jgi:hypothetical protein
LSAYLAEVLYNKDTVRDGTVLSGEGDSGPVQVRRTEGHVGRAVVVNQLDCDLKKENLSETDVYLSKRKVYASVNIPIYFSPKNVSIFVAWILQRCSSGIYVIKDCKEYTQ